MACLPSVFGLLAAALFRSVGMTKQDTTANRPDNRRQLKNVKSTSIQQGGGESNGVTYAFSLFSNVPWFGCYKCRVHKHFLDSPPRSVCTEEFQIGQYRWLLKLTHKIDGNLSAHLQSRNQFPVTVHYSIAVISHTDSKMTRRFGGFRQFQPSQTWGFRNHTSLSNIREESSGFLINGFLAVEIAVRIRLQENESFAVSGDSHSAGCAWKVKGLSDSSPFALCSPEFNTGDLKWRLEVLPYGEKGDSKWLEVYLRSQNRSTIRARVKFRAVNRSMKKGITRDYTHTFGQSNTCWGFESFLKVRAIENESLGFLDNDWTTFAAELVIEHRQESPTPPAAIPPVQARGTGEDPKCVFCIDKVQSAGVLHGNTTHKCYCSDCAKLVKRCQSNLNCPICGEKVDLIIEQMF